MTFDGVRPNQKDRERLIDDLVKVTERLQAQNAQLLRQAETIVSVISSCTTCSETLTRREADASKKLGSGDLG